MLGRAWSAAVLGSFLLAVVGEHTGQHTCPMHDGPGTRAAEHGHAQHQHGGAPSDSPSHTGPCTCIGSCHGSAATPVPVERAAMVGALDLVVAKHASPRRAITLRPRGAFFVPYPNGPPST